MKNLTKIFCFIIMVFLCLNTVGCKKAEECAHAYNLTGLSVDENLNIDKPGVYTCSKCSAQKIQSVGYEELGLPTIDFSGSLDGISKENELGISIKYKDDNQEFDCDAKIKVQGASSAGYDKKNYTIKFYQKDTNYDKKYKVELVEGWGKENKYCLKANYVDYSQARNVVSAKLYGEIAKSRQYNDEINNLYNGGAIDGYPVVIFLNGAFLGLYTLNIPKDKWLFDMEDYDPEKHQEVPKQAMLMADDWGNSTCLKETMNYDFNSSGWDLEFCSTEDHEIGTDWVAYSFNRFITFLNNSTNEELKNGLEQYVDINRAIDCFIYTNVIHGVDNTAKNILWVTYDGTKWIPSMYDLDGTWGLFWNGFIYDNETIATNILINNLLYEKLVELYFDEIAQRYIELRSNILSFSNIKETFEAFFNSIPQIIRNAEKAKWTKVPNQEANNLGQIIEFTTLRLTILDEYFIFNIN